jgi:hypothetical protein
MEHVHSLCLTEGSDDKGYPELYDKIARYTSQNFAVIYAVERDTTLAVRRMSRHGLEVESLIESGALTIVARDRMYSVEKTGLEGHALLESWHDVMLRVKKISDSKGMLAIGSAAEFFEHDVDLCKLVKYEELVGRKFHIPFEALCCYSENAINRLSLGHLAAILNAHYSTVHNASSYREWRPERIIELTRSVMTRELGAKTSDLIFQAIRRHYDIQHAEMVSGHMVLEDALRGIMGKTAAEVTLRLTKEELRKLIRF